MRAPSVRKFSSMFPLWGWETINGSATKDPASYFVLLGFIQIGFPFLQHAVSSATYSHERLPGSKSSVHTNYAASGLVPGLSDRKRMSINYLKYSVGPMEIGPSSTVTHDFPVEVLLDAIPVFQENTLWIKLCGGHTACFHVADDRAHKFRIEPIVIWQTLVNVTSSSHSRFS